MTRLALLALFTLAACATTTAPTVREGPARIGQTVYVDGLRVRPIALIEDSRCPANARCIWAGRVVVRAIVITGAGKREIDLTLGEPKPVADGTLSLVSVAPEKSTRPIAPADYRFAFEFHGGL